MGKVSQLIEGLLYILAIIISTFIYNMELLFRLPHRLFYCTKRGHNWVLRRRGIFSFFGFFDSGKRFKCSKCGCATNVAPSNQIKLNKVR